MTVDLLTTGIDVPEICNLVFLRRVNSRILFDQMLGRATRLCDEIGKETFRIFDAVRIYEALQNLTDMKPVVVDPKITFSQLTQEMAQVAGEEERALAREQFIAKLQRKKRHLNERNKHDFEAVAGMSPEDFVDRLRAMPLKDIAAWFAEHPGLGEILDRKGEGNYAPQIYISEHQDNLISAEHGYGAAKKPADYLQEFAEFIRQRSNTIPALVTVLTRPKELTRRQLRELALELDRAGFIETNLAQPGATKPRYSSTDRWLHSAGRDWRCADTVRTARGSGANKSSWLPPLDYAAAPMAAKNRRADKSQSYR